MKDDWQWKKYDRRRKPHRANDHDQRLLWRMYKQKEKFSGCEAYLRMMRRRNDDTTPAL
jgi:hypothetical protein